MELGTVTAFVAISAAIFVGFLGNLIFVKYRVPDVLILVAFGMIIGPDILGEKFNLVTLDTLSGIEKYRDLFLSAALVLILFEGGLSLDVRSVMESMRLSTFVTVLTLLSEITIIAIALHFILGMDLLLAFVIGAIVGGTSEAVVIPIANKLRISQQTKSMLIMESVVTDVLVIVIALTLMSMIELGDFSASEMAKELAVKFLVGGLVGFLAGIAWLYVLQGLQNQPLSYMITVGALFLVAGFVEMPAIGSSAAVAALTFGLAIGNRRFVKRRLTSVSLRLSSDEHIQEFHSEITFFVRTFFYVYLGMLFRFGDITGEHIAIALGIIVVIAAVRRITSMMAWKIGDMERSDANALFAMMPRGLATAVLATMPATMLSETSVWKDEYSALILNIALIVILGTTIITTVLSFATEKGIDRDRRARLRARVEEEG